MVALSVLLPLCPAQAQQQKKSDVAPAALAHGMIRSVTNHVPIPTYVLEAIEKANASDQRGELLLKAGIYNDAISAFQEAFTYEPHDGSAYKHLAEAYTAIGQPDKAIAAYRTLFYDWPGKGWGSGFGSNTTVLMQFALVLLQTGQTAEALRVYQQGFHYLPTDRGPLPPLFTSPDFATTDFKAAAYTAMGVHELAGGDAMSAPTYFERAISIQPRLAAPYFYRGDFLDKKAGHEQEALDSFSKAAQLGGPEMKPFLRKALKEGTTEFDRAVEKAGMSGQ